MTLTICSAHAQSIPVLTNLFKLNAGAYDDLVVSGNNNRGVAISPVTGNILYASTAGGVNHVTVIDGQTGAFLRSLDGTGVSGGTLALIGVRVATDGAVYAMNLGGSANFLKLYRWESEEDPNPPVNVLNHPAPPVRTGDAFDLRGEGTNTQIIAAGSSGNQWALITPDPANPAYTNEAAWIATFYTFPPEVPAGDLAHGLSFDGTNNAIYGKKSGGTILRHVGFSPDLTTPTNWLIRSIETAQTRLVGTKFFETNGVKLLAGVMYGTGTGSSPPEHRARVYDISNPSALALILDDLMPGPYAANGNGIGASDIGRGKVAFLEPNNGLSVYSLRFVSEIGPSITAQPVGNSNVLWGGYFTLDVSANGTAPLQYQWFLNGTPVPAATNKSLAFSNLDYTNAGSYTVQVSNVVSAVTSAPAYLGVAPSGGSRSAQPIWAMKPGDTFYLTADNTQRGLAYNPASANLLLVSRAPSNGVHVVNANTGAYLRSLDLTGVGGISGSTFDINMVAVADDGAVYVSGLTTTGTGYAIYRWADDSAGTLPAIAYQDDPLIGRVGDTLAAYGSGVNTLLFASARNGNKVAVFSTADGLTFAPNIVEVTGVPDGFAGLGLFPTASNVFWGKAFSQPLRQITFDLANQTNGVTAEVPAGIDNVNAIAVDDANHLAAGIGISQYPQNLALYDIRGVTTTNDSPVLLDQDWFLTSNPNGNGTGQVAIDFAGGRVFALNSNNGLLALLYAPPLRHEVIADKLVLSWAGPAVLTRAPSAAGPYVDVAGASGVYTNTSTDTVFYRLRR